MLPASTLTRLSIRKQVRRCAKLARPSASNELGKSSICKCRLLGSDLVQSAPSISHPAPGGENFSSPSPVGGAIRSESYANAAINQRRVRTASGSDRILRATQDKPNFTSYYVIQSLPVAVLTRLVATLAFNYTPRWEKAKLSGRPHLKPSSRPSPKGSRKSKHAPQLMQHRQIFILALLRLLRIAPDSAR